MSVATYPVLIGSMGWKHKAWEENYYPEDIPAEWMLGFYSNEFPVVFVPSEQWCAHEFGDENKGELQEWCEDISETFQFLLEVPTNILVDSQAFEECLERAKQFGSHCLGLVLKIDNVELLDEKQLSVSVEKAKLVSRVCIHFPTAELTSAFSQLLEKLDVSMTWNGVDDKDSKFTASGDLVVTIIQGESMEPANLRTVLEYSLNASRGDKISVLIIDGDPPSLEVMRNADIILGLL